MEHHLKGTEKKKDFLIRFAIRSNHMKIVLRFLKKIVQQGNLSLLYDLCILGYLTHLGLKTKQAFSKTLGN